MTETDVTETTDVTPSAGDPTIGAAVELIDRGLSDLLHRELVSTDEVSDLLLDVRMLLTTPDDTGLDDTAPVRPEAPVGA